MVRLMAPAALANLGQQKQPSPRLWLYALLLDQTDGILCNAPFRALLNRKRRHPRKRT